MPGWPLPTFSTASAARMRAVSTARSSMGPRRVLPRGCLTFRADRRPIAVIGRSCRAADHAASRAPRRRGDAGVGADGRRALPSIGTVALARARTAAVRPRLRRMPCSLDRRTMTAAVDDRPCATPATASASSARSTAYVALTKPRVIELLLVTTAPVMVLAGAAASRTSGSCSRTLIGGTLSAGIGQRLQLLHRPRHRRA